MKKKIGIIALVILLVIAIGVIYYHKVIGWVFDNLTAPTYELDESTDEWSGGTFYEKVNYASVSESDYVNIYVPDDVENPPLFVLVHGGGFVSNDATSRQAQLMYRYFRDHGFACASVNYRLAQEEIYPAALEDVKACVRYLRAHAKEYGYDASSIAIWGESAGGYLATMAAVTGDDEFCDLEYIDEDIYGDVSAKVSVLVDYYGVIDMETAHSQWKEVGLPAWVYDIANNWVTKYIPEDAKETTIESYWLGKEISDMTKEEINEISPMYYLEKNTDLDLAIWICHGDSDITVPILQSQYFYEDAKALLGEKNVSYVVIENGKHADDRCYSQDQLEKLCSFINEHL
ncbi:MAG: alpha/beta hydrolase [Lachnospiraceae bacterium]|nr:alpha/beta hydrolase [Lachnospiraceae bacterium]